MIRPRAIPAALGVLVWLAAAGCVHTRGREPAPPAGSGFATAPVPPGKSQPNSFDHPNVESSSVRPASASVPPNAQPLPPPRVEQPPTVPPGPEWWHPGMPQLPGPFEFNDPHTRNTPTATGAMLNLQPGEVPTDRVVSLAREVGLLTAQLDVQQACIKELEAAALTREQSLAIAQRELEALRGDAADVAKAKAETAAAYTELLAAKDKLRTLQMEDIETLKQIVRALERLLPPPRREP